MKGEESLPLVNFMAIEGRTPSSLNNMKFFTAVVVSTILICSSITAAAGARRRAPKRKTISLNGLRIPIPKGYIQFPQSSSNNAVFLFNRKSLEGIVLAVPDNSMVGTDLLPQLSAAALKSFFPKDDGRIDWKQFHNHRTISKFELGGSEEMGFDGQSLFIVHSHRFRIASKDLFLMDIFKWTEGNPGEVFDGGLGAESMQLCNDKVEILYAVTHEKINGTNSPCELISVPN